jgi:hypothetical protein
MLIYGFFPAVTQFGVVIGDHSEFIVQSAPVASLSVLLNEIDRIKGRQPDAVGIIDPGNIDEVRKSKMAYFRLLEKLRKQWDKPVPIYSPSVDGVKRLVTGDRAITEKKLLMFVHKHGLNSIATYHEAIAACMVWYVQGALRRGDEPDLI